MLLNLRPALVFISFFTALLGLAYPLTMNVAGRVLFPAQAGGSLMTRGGVVVGSGLIGQEFTRAGYLHGRPSITEPAYDARASGGSNLAPSSAVLLELVRARAASFGALPVPSEMATASGSGLDPQITLQAALLQVPRIAAVRGLAEDDVIAVIRRAGRGPAFGFLGQPVVNVLEANLGLDLLKS